MKVEITNISGAHDVLLAAGITAWLTDAGVEVHAPSSPLALSVRPVSSAPDAPEPSPAPAAEPTQQRGKRVAKKASKPVEKREADKPAEAPAKMTKADAVRIAMSNHGKPMTNSEIMRATGLGSQDVSVTMWSLRNQGEVRKNESVTPALWSLA